jgi:hypothetical protein
MLRRFKKKGNEEEQEKTDMSNERFPTEEEFRKIGLETFNARPIMREYPQFALLGFVLGWIRPWSQNYEELPVDQLKVLEKFFDEEVRAVREALMKKVSD